uniref:Uncharacterized protein n=1 Tax=Micrurus spixii TaxID=129469 RepID=A0A2D4MDY4_9SAUR
MVSNLSLKASSVVAATIPKGNLFHRLIVLTVRDFLFCSRLAIQMLLTTYHIDKNILSLQSYLFLLTMLRKKNHPIIIAKNKAQFLNYMHLSLSVKSLSV